MLLLLLLQLGALPRRPSCVCLIGLGPCPERIRQLSSEDVMGTRDHVRGPPSSEAARTCGAASIYDRKLVSVTPSPGRCDIAGRRCTQC